jgi:hypothetical protein
LQLPLATATAITILNPAGERHFDLEYLGKF